MKIEELELVNKYVPTKKQLIAHNSKARFVLFGGSVGPGKTTWLVNHVILHCLSFPGAKALICRKYFSDLVSTTYETLLEWLPSRYKLKIGSSEITFRNGSKILLRGTGESEKDLTKLSGLEISMCALDQADEVPEKAFNILSLRLRLKPKKPSPVPIFYQLIATANPGPTWVRERWLDRSLPDHEFIQALPSENPYLPVGYLESLKLSLSPDIAKQLLEGDFYSVSSLGGLFGPAEIDRAMAKKAKTNDNEVWAADIGKGLEETVLTKLSGNRVEIVDAFLEKDLTKATKRIAKHVKDKLSLIKIDGIGIGQAVIAVLRELGYSNVQEIIGSEKARNNRFINIKSENYWNLLKNLPHLSLPKDQILRTQMVNCRERKYEGKQAIESRAELSARGCSCPNRLDALVLVLSGIVIGAEEEAPTTVWHPLLGFKRALGMSGVFFHELGLKLEQRKNAMTKREQLQKMIDAGWYIAGDMPRWCHDEIARRKKDFDTAANKDDLDFLNGNPLKWRKF